MGNADHLCRAPHIMEDPMEDQEEEAPVSIEAMQITKDVHLPRLLDEWRTEQQQDWELRQTRDWILNGKESVCSAPAVRHYDKDSSSWISKACSNTKTPLDKEMKKDLLVYLVICSKKSSKPST